MRTRLPGGRGRREGGVRERVYLWWIGAGPPEASMEAARSRLEEVFGMPVVREARPGRPLDAWDPRRGQVLSGRLLSWLANQAPPDAARVVGVTDEDLFIPVLTFVFGEAQLAGKAAVVSVARLRPDAGAPEPARLLSARLQTECVHELGHTWGLVHCDRTRCAMSRSVSVVQVDLKSPGLCEDCRVRLADARGGGGTA